jgi:hydrogenase maturation protein HypF
LKQRVHGIIRGAVQGVGFRPFVYRLARELGLDGWVNNSSQGVFFEAEGEPEALTTFLRRLQSDHPPRAFIQSFEHAVLDPSGTSGFVIRPSDPAGEKTALVMPDIALCDDCRRELFDPHNRRYRYPFINCTNCGPRYSIISALPYDRPNTTMLGFIMCPACRQEYEDPADRRFHAQPNACPECGPHIELWDAQGAVHGMHDEALTAAVSALAGGKILAVKGIGGFHLMADAGNEEAVRRLRARKHREEKPFAMMAPSVDLVKDLCEVDEEEERLLTAPEAPIVLLRRRDAQSLFVAHNVAPHNPCFGIMVPYAPLHHLLLADFGRPVVATSGNLSDEPLCTDEREALRRLAGIADCFLVHNRPITRHVDDSIVRVTQGRAMMLRRARGYAPLPLRLPAPVPDTLAVGAHLKNTIAFSRGRDLFVSQHLGDLETPEAFAAFRAETAQLQGLFDVHPTAVVSDSHPDYLSSTYAASRPGVHHRIQHHVAHVAACMVENDIATPFLGVAWDGTGLGDDGSIWGGEFFVVRDGRFDRRAHLRTFLLPGGDTAAREPRRAALGLLHAIAGDAAFAWEDLHPVAAFTQAERSTLQQMLDRRFHAPVTSSAGRLFDGVSALLGIRQRNTFEGQAAMELEWSAAPALCEPYPLDVMSREPGTGAQAETLIIDWEPLVRGIIADVRQGIARGVIAGRFHRTMAAAICEVARRLGLERVALSGGCFQNALLSRWTAGMLSDAGFRVYVHQRIPPNDGGIAVGQIAAAAFQGLLKF